MPAEVTIVYQKPPLDDTAIPDMVRQAINSIGNIRDLIKPGNTVLIKPNLFAPIPAPATTDPRVVKAVIQLVKEANPANIIVADSRSISTFKLRTGKNTTWHVFQTTGMLTAVKEVGAQPVCLEEDEFIQVKIKDAQVLHKVLIPRAIHDADVLINLPVMKIHSLTLVTLGIKNLHGIVADEYKLFAHNYKQLPQKLVDILRVKKPALTLIDGIQAREYDHAEDGFTVPMGMFIASCDTVAADAVSSALIGIKPMEVDTTRIAHQQGLGTADLTKITIKGTPIEAVKKPLRRPDIELIDVFPEVTVYAGDYCRACQYYSRRGLDKLKQTNTLQKIGGLTLIIGREPQVPEWIEGKVIIHGDCAIFSESTKMLRYRLWLKDQLRLVFGCPPMEFRERAVELVS